MPFKFIKIKRNEYIPTTGKNTIFLQENNWDDYGYKTIFSVFVFDEIGTLHDLGIVKIGYKDQDEGWTSDKIDNEFTTLSDDFFSLGQEPEYYENIYNNLSKICGKFLLSGLRDIVFDNATLVKVKEDADKRSDANLPSVFNVSLLRSVSYSVITSQFVSIVNGELPLTEYDFFYEKESGLECSGIKLDFKVDLNLKPLSNMHVLIGRNGSGKTTIINNMVKAIIQEENDTAKTGYFGQPSMFGAIPLDDDYFRGVVSVSFSAFDQFDPPAPQPNINDGICYHYIGLKTINQPNYAGEDRLKNKAELCNELVESLKVCFSLGGKRDRWLNAVKKLESDINLANLDLASLVDNEARDDTERREKFGEVAINMFSTLSTGHAIVLLTLTKLIETVEEKTLVLIDEPESHLHPPLLSAFVRALSELLINRNGVAIIATHSPVVLQEVPKNCVSIIRRAGSVAQIERPSIETFGENVGTLTREIFGLEVSKSGFYELLAESVSAGNDYETIMGEYGHQIGFEGQAILRALISSKGM